MSCCFYSVLNAARTTWLFDYRENAIPVQNIWKHPHLRMQVFLFIQAENLQPPPPKFKALLYPWPQPHVCG